MRILLLGDLSGYFVNLSEGLQKLGHKVTLASDGDSWRGFKSDIKLPKPGSCSKVRYFASIVKHLPNFRNYDVVQLVTPNFLLSNPSATKYLFKYIKAHNKKVYVSACTMDYIHTLYSLNYSLDRSPFKHKALEKDKYLGEMRNQAYNKSFASLSKMVAEQSDGIIAISHEYFQAYKHYYPNKTSYIPLPINNDKYRYVNTLSPSTTKIRFLLGKMGERQYIKGMDRIHNALKSLEKTHPDQVELVVVDSLPFKEYIKVLDSCHILCDQLYGYGAGMNGLVAMAKGLVLAGSASEQMYKHCNEAINKPIIDLEGSDKHIYSSLENIIINKSTLIERANNSRKFIEDHHSYTKVAQKYIDIWTS